MVNYALLRQTIDNRGVKVSHLAKVLDVTPQAMRKKLNGTIQFKVDELPVMANALFLAEEDIVAIFLCPNVI